MPTLFEEDNPAQEFEEAYFAHLLAHPPTPSFAGNPGLCRLIARKDVKRVSEVLDSLGLTITKKGAADVR